MSHSDQGKVLLFSRLMSALADHTETLPDDQLVEDCKAAGDDPAVVASGVRRVLRQAVDETKASVMISPPQRA